jgi:predicted DNA-binding transcriptional regulator AlpA
VTTLDDAQIISTRQAAALIGTSADVLRAMRHRGTGPKFHRIEGVQSVLYLRSEVEDFIAERALESA